MAKKNRHAVALQKARMRKVGPARRIEIARMAAVARWGARTTASLVATLPDPRNPLAETLRRQTYEAMGPREWERACRLSLALRLGTGSGPWIVRRLAAADGMSRA